jgi:hypothetical protein
MPQLIWISGPPASGKSTLTRALARRFDLAIGIPVDDIREWVLTGYAGPVPWTAATEAQYRLGETCACRVAEVYFESKFTPLIDACRNPARIDELLQEIIPSVPVAKVLLLPSLSENYRRAASRTNKSFDPHFLDGVIASTHAAYGNAAGKDWLRLDNSEMSVEDEVDRVIEWAESRPP